MYLFLFHLNFFDFLIKNKINMKNYNVFFAFGKAVESKESTPVKRYVGVAPVFVLAVNPNKADLEKLLKNEGHMPEDKFLVMSRKGKRLGVPFASTPRGEGGAAT